MEPLFDQKDKKSIVQYSIVLIVILCIYFAVGAITELKKFSYIGADIQPTRTVSLEGKGEMLITPDVATFTYGVVENASTAKEAQTRASTKSNAVIDALKKAGIAEKDIKTVSYNINPVYQYVNSVCVAGGDCRPSTQKISGYEVNQSVEVKVRKVDTAGDMLALVGGLNVSNVSNLNFVLDDMDAAQAKVRALAIQDAREKAKVLAHELGVNIDTVVTFNENGGSGYPVVMYDKAMLQSSSGSMATVPSPDLPTGQNKLTSNVTVVYEIR